jgi:hypothetical protein
MPFPDCQHLSLLVSSELLFNGLHDGANKAGGQLVLMAQHLRKNLRLRARQP